MTNKATNPPVELDKFREEVRARLEEIGDPRRAAAFAFRMALTALPGLANEAETKGFLWYWPGEKREKYLLAVCRALQFGFVFGTDEKIIPHTYFPIAAAAVTDAVVYDPYADLRADSHVYADAIYAAFVAVNAATDNAHTNASYAATNAVRSTYATRVADVDTLIGLIWRELARLAESKNALAYLVNPPPIPFPERQQAFLSQLRQLPTFDYWADWFQDRYDGKPAEWGTLKKSVLLPEEIANQEPRAINRYLKELASGSKERNPVGGWGKKQTPAGKRDSASGVTGSPQPTERGNSQAKRLAENLPLVTALTGHLFINRLLNFPVLPTSPPELGIETLGKGAATADWEEICGIGHTERYFLAGLPSGYFGAFGDVVLAYEPSIETSHTGEVNPFDTGELYGRNLHPRYPSEDQVRKLIERTKFNLGNWREHFSEFLGEFFPDGRNYLTDTPRYEGKWGPSDLPARDFRNRSPSAWTWEIRLHEPHPLLEGLILCVLHGDLHQRLREIITKKERSIWIKPNWVEHLLKRCIVSEHPTQTLIDLLNKRFFGVRAERSPQFVGPVDIDRFREEVKAHLEGIHDPWRIAAFAWRMALTALPALNDQARDKGFLWYWKESERDANLFSICRSQQFALFVFCDDAVTIKIDPPGVSASHAAAETSYTAYAARAAADATQAAVRATFNSGHIVWDAAADAASNAALAAYTDDDTSDINTLVEFARQELERLGKSKGVSAYLINPPPLPFPEQQQQFLAHLREVPSFEYWADWLQDRFEGKPWNEDLTKKSLDPPKEIANQDTRAINHYLKELATGVQNISSVDIDEFRQEAWACLQKIRDPWRSAAFAWRMALAVLPMLTPGAEEMGKKWGFLRYWKEEDREKHLFAVCRAQQVGFFFAMNREILPFEIRWPASDIAEKARADAYHDHPANSSEYGKCIPYANASYINALGTVALAAYAAALCPDERIDQNVARTADAAVRATLRAAYTVTDASTDVHELLRFVKQELDRLIALPNAATFLIDTPSSPFPAQQQRFLEQLRQLPTFDYWADWFQDRYDGKPIDPEILKASVLLPKEIESQDPRTINRYLKELASGKDFHILNARRLLAQGDYDAARIELLKIPETAHETDVPRVPSDLQNLSGKQRPNRGHGPLLPADADKVSTVGAGHARDGLAWQQVRTEFGFAFDFTLDEELDAERRKKLMGQMEWRRKVFAVLGSDALSEETEAVDKGKSDTGEEDAREQADAGADVEKTAEAPGIESREELSPQQQGEKLERDTLELLRQIFRFDDEAVQIEKLRQQKRGAQLGFDIKLEACLAANNENVRCCVECKSHEKELRFEDVVAKLLDAEANQAKIDHWILIAPRAKLLGNRPDDLVDKWNAEQKWPFTVQLWMADTEVWSLFGLAPDIYDDWIADHPPDEPHPRDWSQEKREAVRQRWLGKLKPPLRLPQAWSEYVTDPDENGIFMENDDREDLKALREEQRYIPPGALDESGSPLPGGLEKAVRDWLDEGPRIGIVLGEFGDGKSAFTYMFSRALLDEFRGNPSDGWLPVRFPLRYFARPNTASSEFFEYHLKKLGSGLHEWDRKIVGKRKLLVILDGMDEMTKSLTREAVREVVKLLVDCCNSELEQVPKILITCRRTFFEELTQRRYVVGKLKDPAIFRIEPFSKAQVYEKLEALAGAEQRPRLRELRQMHDPIGLARKALFFKMVSQTLAKSDADFSSETGIYRGYVEDCLGRKSDYLESGGQDVYGDAIVAGMLSVMERIAMEMHLSDRDYFCLGHLADEGRAGTLDKPMGGKSIAEILWKDITKDEKTETDAVHRVGVRSLLSRVTGRVEEQDKDRWPVEFCHRSVREWFVARGIEQALREGREQAEKVIATVDTNHEVLRFTVELMQAQTARDGYDYTRTLRELANLSRRDEQEVLDEDEWNRRCRLGRTAITLLYKWSGRLDANDWSRMLLDGAKLAGADLTGKNFYGTSLRYANLNNAILDKTDLRFADLTGVRLEEAGEIASLSVPRSADAFFAAYRDGTIRKWPLDTRSDQHPAVVFQLSEDYKPERSGPLRIAALPQARPSPGLCLWDRETVRFLDTEGETYHQVSRFSLAEDYPAIAVAERNMAVLVGGQTDTRREARLFDFSPEGLPSMRAFPPDSFVECVALNHLVEGGALAGILTDGRVVAHARGDGTGDATRTTTLGNLPASTCIAAYGTSELSREFGVACGNRDGLVTAWRFTLNASGTCTDVEELFHGKVHAGAVRALCFVDGETLLTGGADGKIHRFYLPEGRKPRKTFELKLRCRGTKIEGLQGKKEREILRAAGEGSWSAPESTTSDREPG